MSLEEATLARLPFDVAEHIDIEEEKKQKERWKNISKLELNT